MRRRVAWLAVLAVGVLLALSVLERHVWIGALLAELRSWLALAALLVVVMALAARERIAALLALVLAVVAALPSAQLYRSTRPTPQAGPLLRVAHVHVAGEPLSRTALTNWLSTLGEADLAVLTGLRGADQAALPASLAGFSVHAAPNKPALLVASRAQGARFPSDLGELQSVSLAVGRCRVRVVALDLPSRFERTATLARARTLAALEKVSPIVRSVWLGHLGSRVGASDLATLLEAQELRDSRRSHGLLATAPQALGALGLPLDHVLVHGWVGVRERSVQAGATPDSHRTVRATLELTEPRCRL